MLNIRTATANDINRVVEIHMSAFKGFFMTELGNKFIEKYYETVLNYPKNIFLVAECKKDIVGFVVGFMEPSEFYTFFKKQKYSLTLIILTTLIKKPWILLKIFSDFFRVHNLSMEKTNNQCELASIAVDPKYAKKGYGKLLVITFIEKSNEREAKMIYLTTDANNNDSVNRFYKSLGFKLHRKFRSSHARIMNEYRYYLSEN